jgi:mRNA deadenylase 3'-5' endonuclease subunit Ccr4
MYALVTSGTLPDDRSVNPEGSNPQNWRLSVGPADALRSAYADAGGEPAFTNKTIPRGQPDGFCGVLDYIFVSRGIAVDSVLPLPPSREAASPAPNADEPSDHWLIAADLSVGGV